MDHSKLNIWGKCQVQVKVQDIVNYIELQQM